MLHFYRQRAFSLFYDGSAIAFHRGHVTPHDRGGAPGVCRILRRRIRAASEGCVVHGGTHVLGFSIGENIFFGIFRTVSLFCFVLCLSDFLYQFM